ncbi:MAG: 30S ribosomal protein S19 [Candidatus Aenigmarchaeota archaeon]|nr:30S ribosomal protein S19 [Candidatus Aenigmarchaeota archaeon]
MAKEFTYRGKTVEEIKKMSLAEYSALLTSRERRRIKNGFRENEQRLLAHLKGNKKEIRTHCRSIPILPEMFGKTIKVYSGKEFVPVMVVPEMIGHRLGEYVMTRKKVSHSAPGIGATRSSASLSVR